MTETTLMTEAANTTEGQASTTTTASTTVVPVDGQTQQATEGQTTEGQLLDGAKPEAKVEPTGAPEKYELKAPEDAAMDEAGIASFSELAKELNLTQDAAQKMIDKMAPAMQARQADAMQAAKAKWAEESTTDAEFGGQKLTENVAIADKALTQFGTPELRTLLKESGLGNHPEIIRAFYRAGKAISEDGSFVNGNKGATTETAAQRMYPNMNP
jgi:hypothetical protein